MSSLFGESEGMNIIIMPSIMPVYQARGNQLFFLLDTEPGDRGREKIQSDANSITGLLN